MPIPERLKKNVELAKGHIARRGEYVEQRALEGLREKAVRDRIRHLNKAETRIASVAEFMPLLKAKLVEEAKEVVEAKTEEEMLDELGDLFEVMLAVADWHDIGLRQIMDAAGAKRASLGGFDGRVVLREAAGDV